MNEEPRTSGPPGERRLDRPPSDRYRPSDEPDAADVAPAERSVLRNAAIAGIGVAVGAVAITVAGGILTYTAGLLVVAAAIGWALGGTFAARTSGLGRGGGPIVAVALAGAAVGLGQLGLWLLARQEGGTLGFVDYLGQVFGPLVPLQFLLAVVVAWWRAR